MAVEALLYNPERLYERQLEIARSIDTRGLQAYINGYSEGCLGLGKLLLRFNMAGPKATAIKDVLKERNDVER